MSLRKQINESANNSVGSPSHSAGLMNKWKKFLTGIEQPRTRAVMAQLFENQSQYMLNEETNTGNTGEYLKYTFPLLRRVWAQLIANDVVSVQPKLA